MVFEHKCVLVTGASGGIGQVLVAQLMAQGARVARADKELCDQSGTISLAGDLLDASYCDHLPPRGGATVGGA